jgi:predicted TIM-barrel fold metal-dependent hydrolase
MPDYPDPTATVVSPTCAVPIELLDEYLDEYGVERAVLVQPIYPGEDNSYVADCAAAHPDRYAAVCVVDPGHPQAAERLDYWVRRRGCRGLRLRPRLPREAEFFGRAASIPLWKRAEELGVVVTLLAGSEHLPAVGELAARFSSVPIVVDHLAYPDPLAGPEGTTLQLLCELAVYENVYLKASGYHYFSRQPYPYWDCVPLFRRLLEKFGPRRLVWGSDFPHVLLKCGYGRGLRLLEEMHPNLDKSARDLMLGENARRLYWPGS